MRQAAGIIVKYQNEVLLCKRSEEIQVLNGYWSIPGGGKEKGESSMDAALREFKEETNLDIDSRNIMYVGSSYNTTKKGKTRFDVFMTEVNEKVYPDLDNALDGMEHSECGYFTIDNLPSPLLGDLKDIISEII